MKLQINPQEKLKVVQICLNLLRKRKTKIKTKRLMELLESQPLKKLNPKLPRVKLKLNPKLPKLQKMR